MDPATIALIIKIIEALIALAPEVPEIIDGAKAAIESLTNGTPMDPAVIASIEALLDKNHAALQAPMADETPPVAST